MKGGGGRGREGYVPEPNEFGPNSQGIVVEGERVVRGRGGRGLARLEAESARMLARPDHKLVRPDHLSGSPACCRHRTATVWVWVCALRHPPTMRTGEENSPITFWHSA